MLSLISLLIKIFIHFKSFVFLKYSVLQIMILFTSNLWGSWDRNLEKICCQRDEN